MNEFEAKLYHVILDIFQQKDKERAPLTLLSEVDARSYANRIAIAVSREAYRHFNEKERKSGGHRPVCDKPLDPEKVVPPKGGTGVLLPPSGTAIRSAPYVSDNAPEHVTDALAALERLAHAAGKNYAATGMYSTTYARQPHKCPVCGGKGYKTPKLRYGRGKRDNVPCVACKGAGIVWDPEASRAD